MVEGICEEVKDITYNRVFAIGGGTILDVAKLFALKQVSPVVDLYDGKIKAEKEKQLILIPTTCGTGSDKHLHSGTDNKEHKNGISSR